MPNLVGTGLNQVPTNSMLGGMAYQDPEHASIKNLDLKNLSQINSEIADTAVDVFVYDTRKDSDGGAWRKRTQNTSWYNETLNTATRGSRKEFPAVAVIVAELTKVTIYDGDDPDLPMWMVFNVGGTAWTSVNLLAQSGASTNWSLSAVNGTICIAPVTSYRLRVINFISEYSYVTSNAGGKIYNGSISERNSGRGFADSSNIGSTVNGTFNDVAMTVLPNAPIDPSTGLPIPTIAVATDGGVSIIKDDGTVVDITSGTIIHHEPRGVDFFGSRLFWTEGNNYDLQDRAFLNASIPSADIVLTHNGALPGGYIGYGLGGGATNVFNNYAFNLPLNTEVSPRERKFQIGGPDNNIFLGCKHAVNGGIEHIHQNIESPSNGMVVTTTSSYNTGWMHGDCKGAFLSGISTTSMPGSNIITNGDFSNGSTGWTVQSGWTVSSGTATCDGTNGAYIYQPDTGEIPANTAITVTLTITAYTSGSIRMGSTGTSPSTIHSGTGTYSTTFVTRSSASSGVEIYSVNFVGTIDNVIVTLAEEDRSVNNNPLQVFGTITKTAVATGADLVAYGPFSDSNYLYQPYNSDLDFGTGDFSVMLWLKSNSTGYVYWRNDTTGAPLIDIYVEGTDNLRFRLTSIQEYITAGVDTTKWTHVCWMRKGGVAIAYVNGVNRLSTPNTSDLTNPDAPIYIGRRVGSGAELTNGYVSLLRVSASAPSPEQIKKIYEDEKVLFQENAKCTLYGSSDAVTALAFDDTTNLLHVGTSAGRSEFQGLRRINNTTDAVTTAISASNGLVAEQ